MPTAKPRRALIVEDHADSAESLSILLDDMGLDVQYLTDSRLALDLARRFRPHFVFCDIGMPHLDGYEVAQLLRPELQNSAWLIALTGHGSPMDRERSRKAGFDAHVLKPIDMPLLNSILAQFEG